MRIFQDACLAQSVNRPPNSLNPHAAQSGQLLPTDVGQKTRSPWFALRYQVEQDHASRLPALQATGQLHHTDRVHQDELVTA